MDQHASSITAQVGQPSKPDLNGHQVEDMAEDEPHANGHQKFESILRQLDVLSHEQVEELGASLIARMCLRKQEENLKEYLDGFAACADTDFKAMQPNLLQSFLDMVAGMKIKSTEQPLESTCSREGTVTILVPGLPDGVTVTRSRDTFFVNEERTLLERNEVRVRLAGLNVYSGYWLAVDAPTNGIEDPLQEEGIDTLRRVMEAAGIKFTDEVYEDALEYPFISTLLAPFGPDAILPFEEHLRSLHRDYSQRHGGSWYKMTSARKARSKLAEVTEGPNELIEEGDDSMVEDEPEEEEEDEDEGKEPKTVSKPPRGLMTEAEEADLEIDKLNL